MKALVTGADGFIGSHLVEELLQRGLSVRGSIEPSHRIPENCSPKVEWVLGDIRDKQAMEQAMEGCDWVFHLAAIPRYDAGRSSQDYEDVNVTGTENILRAATKRHAKRVVFVSSIEAIGLSPDGKPLTEETPPRPRDDYGASKFRAEQKVREYTKNGDCDGVIIRIGLTYGPGEKMVYNRFFRVVHHGYYPLIGNGNVLMEFAYVRNQTMGLWLAAEKGVAGETYFLSDRRPYRFKEVTDSIAAAMGVRLRYVRLPLLAWRAVAVGCELASRLFPFPPFQLRETHRPPFSRRSLQWISDGMICCSTRKAAQTLGFIPPFSLEEGLQETVSWYRKRGWI